MKLCFGSFAKILHLSMEGVSQDKLVALLAKCVHENSSYIANDWRYKDTFDDIKGDKAAISKVVNCKQDFYLPEDKEAPTLNKVIENLKQGVINLMGAKSKTKITLSLIRLIESDESIEDEEKYVFKSIFGLDKDQFILQTSFVFSDFLAKTLLYVTDREIKNTKGKDCIKMISQEYVDDTFNAFAYIYIWDSINEVLTFSGYEILRCFGSILNKNEIKYFIEKIDPTVSLDMDYWDDQIESFSNDIKNDICNVYNAESKVVQVIIEFSNTLNYYFDYLSKGVIFTGVNGAPFVPKFRNQNPKLIEEFANNVKEFREQLCQLYGKMYGELLIERTLFC